MPSSPAPAAGHDLRAKTVRSVGWAAVGAWSARLSSLLVFAVLGRLLDPSEFGLLALSAVFIAGFTLFVDGGFSRAVVQRREVDDAHTSTAFWTSLGTSLVLAGLLCLLAPALEAVLDAPGLAPVVMALSLSLPLVALTAIPSALLEREFRFKALAVRRLVSTFAGSALGIALAVAGAGVWALVAQWLGMSLVGVVVLWRSTTWRPSLQFSREAWRELWAFAHVSLGVDVLLLVNAQADKLIVGALTGPTTLGYYYIGTRMLTLLSDMLTGVIGQLSLTTFARLQDDLPRMRRSLANATFVCACIAFPVFGLCAALAPSIVPFVFGEQWERSVVIMQLLAPASALLAVTYFDKNLFMGAGKPKVALRLTFWQTVVGLAAVAIALPFGIAAAAGARSLRQFAFWPLRLHLLRTHVGVDVRAHTARLIAPLVATLVPVGLILVLQASALRVDSPAAATFGLGGLGLAVFAALLAWFGGTALTEAVAAVLGPGRAAQLRRTRRLSGSPSA